MLQRPIVSILGLQNEMYRSISILQTLRHKKPGKASSQAITLVDTFTSSEKQQVPAERPFTYNAFAPANAHESVVGF